MRYSYDRRAFGSDTHVYATVHDGGVTLWANVDVGHIEVHDLQKNLGLAVDRIRKAMNAGLLRDLNSVLRVTLYGFNASMGDRGRLKVHTILSGKVPSDQMAQVKEIVEQYAKLSRG